MTWTGPTRGQMVVAMAVVVAVALVPVATAYLQLGYAPTDDRQRTGHASAVTSALERAVAGAENEVAGEHSWPARRRAVDGVHRWLDPRLAGIESPDDPDSVAVTVEYNQSLAATVAATECPRGGRGRMFGPCRAREGVVIQRRAGETVVVAVALDVRVVTPRGTTRVARAFRP